MPETRIADLFARHAADGVTAPALADVVVAIWRDIDQALTPILSPRGCALLYQRTLHRSTVIYPWLADAYVSPHSTMGLVVLRGVLAGQSPETVADAGTELFTGFRDQLAALIGAPLTECLLHPLWTHSPHAMLVSDSTEEPSSLR